MRKPGNWMPEQIDQGNRAVRVASIRIRNISPQPHDHETGLPCFTTVGFSSEYHSESEGGGSTLGRGLGRHRVTSRKQSWEQCYPHAGGRILTGTRKICRKEHSMGWGREAFIPSRIAERRPQSEPRNLRGWCHWIFRRATVMKRSLGAPNFTFLQGPYRTQYMWSGECELWLQLWRFKRGKWQAVVVERL